MIKKKNQQATITAVLWSCHCSDLLQKCVFSIFLFEYLIFMQNAIMKNVSETLFTEMHKYLIKNPTTDKIIVAQKTTTL